MKPSSCPQHLFICELDGQEVKTENDCVAKLKRLDGKGRLWPQEMILEINGAYLVLCDIETKVGIDSQNNVKLNIFVNRSLIITCIRNKKVS